MIILEIASLKIAKANVIKKNPELKNLINEVVNRVGLDNVEQINDYGIAEGFDDYGITEGYSGFINYDETVPFWLKYHHDITTLIKQDADTVDETIYDYLSSIRWLRSYYRDELLEALYGSYKEEYIAIYHVFAWYAAEFVCDLLCKEAYNNIR